MAAATEPERPKVYLQPYIEAGSANGAAARRLRSGDCSGERS